jgi:Ca-activated chloride channel family protein
MIEHLHFLRPLWLLTLLPLAWILWRYWHRQQRGGAWQSVCDPHLLPHLLVGTNARTTRTPIVLLGMAGLLTIIALAGPVWSKLPQPVYHNSAATVVLLSLSETMNTPDLKPTRLERAKLKLLDFLQRQREGQTALIAYAGEAYVVSPLTDDAATIESLVTALDSTTMPVAGDNLSEALNKANALLDQDGIYKGGRVLLITDSAGDSAALKRAAALQHKGRVLSVLAVGTQQGAPIAAAGGGFVKDSSGAIVISMLNLPALEKLAAAGHGRVVTLTTSDDDLNNLWPTSQASRFKPQHPGMQHAADVWREQGPWLLLLVLPLVALVWRQGWLAIIVLAVTVQPHPAQASTWDNLWARPDQQAYRALQHGDAKTAATLFKDSRWRSVAQYRAGNYSAAATGFGGEHTPDALYNQGNALARAGKLAEAAQNYRKVLQQQPSNQDAQHNLKIVEDLLKRQQQNKKSAPNKNHRDQQQGKGQQQNKDQNGQAGQKQQAQQGQPKQQQTNNQRGQSGQHQPAQAQADNAQKQQDKQTAQASKTGSTQQDQNKQAGANQNSASAQAKSDDARDDKQKQVQQQQANANKTETKQDQHAGAVAHDTTAKSESAQAMQQWLRRIPDDPGGLLRRKFLLLHQQREQAASDDGT